MMCSENYEDLNIFSCNILGMNFMDNYLEHKRFEWSAKNQMNPS